MEMLIDGELASNNGGWQWSASTGVDPVPYFRIFNPYIQSHKVRSMADFLHKTLMDIQTTYRLIQPESTSDISSPSWQWYEEMVSSP